MSDCTYICTSSSCLSSLRSFQKYNMMEKWKHTSSLYLSCQCIYLESYSYRQNAAAAMIRREYKNNLFSILERWLKEIIVMNTKMKENSSCTPKKRPKSFSCLTSNVYCILLNNGNFLYLAALQLQFCRICNNSRIPLHF